jgi:TolB-like protein
MIAAGTLIALNGSSGAATVGGTLDDRKIAVRYFNVAGGDVAELQPAADRLTESLIRELSALRGLKVISRNGVASLRGADIPRDSVARVLSVGTVVEGTIEPEGAGSVRITVGCTTARAATWVTQDRCRPEGLAVLSRESAPARSLKLRERLGPVEVSEAVGTRSVSRGRCSIAPKAPPKGLRFGSAPRQRQARLQLAIGLSAAESATATGRPSLARVQVAYDRARPRGEDRTRWLDTAQQQKSFGPRRKQCTSARTPRRSDRAVTPRPGAG